MSKINVSYVYQGDITEPEKEIITSTVDFNIDGKMSEYIHKLKKDDATKLDLKVTIEKNKKRLFNGSFVLSASGGDTLRYAREDFNQLTDLVNHAFDHFKEALASK